MLRFGQMRSLQKIGSTHVYVHDHFDPERRLIVAEMQGVTVGQHRHGHQPCSALAIIRIKA